MGPSPRPGHDLFIDPMLGSPLAIYIDKDVNDRENLVLLVTKNGGSISPSYSSVPYILVDPLKPSGQNLYRQYASKKGKIVLSYQWLHECIKAGQLHTFHTNWAGCKLTGNETSAASEHPRRSIIDQQQQQPQQLAPPSQPIQPQILHPVHPTVQELVHHTHQFSFNIYAPPPPPPPPSMSTAAAAAAAASRSNTIPHHPPQTWQTAGAGSIAPQQTQHHLPAQILSQQSHRPDYREDNAAAAASTWGNYDHSHAHTHHDDMAAAYDDYRYTEDHDQHAQAAWSHYYESAATYEDPYPQSTAYLPQPQQQQQEAAAPADPSPQPPPSVPTGPTNLTTSSTTATTANTTSHPHEDQDSPNIERRGRKRTRTGGGGGGGIGSTTPQTDSVVASSNSNSTSTPGSTSTASLVVGSRRINPNDPNTPLPPARSPTPPSRVIKSTYGGNLFTADDVLYLKRYIEYCQEQGLVLSLREICERIAVKAPHHTFYSWRRYCNKHQIRLQGYMMNPTLSSSPTINGSTVNDATNSGNGSANVAAAVNGGTATNAGGVVGDRASNDRPGGGGADGDMDGVGVGVGVADGLEMEMELDDMQGIEGMGRHHPHQHGHGHVFGDSSHHHPHQQQQQHHHHNHHQTSLGSGNGVGSGVARDRSPTPPRVLFRSTTGKGVAFTEEDVTFLKRFMEYRKSQGRFDMVAFWKDVAQKAPHHSRASWMKYWRRHKHELNHTASDDPLPQPPDKKMRYSKADDVLLAQYFRSKPEGTSDKIFQAFGRMHPHHPWKGWQEHHRIHKAKIDHFIDVLNNGESIDVDEPETG
ncbi:hypothetical protein K435DRAFT_137091 [Dendrothele bispora CBS 962.96]|uniref:BRCT domain-containing protein n=1 Tax=Dendrothele bispora (strain CBS 962.96) TaxID=1314807 RepID=A0A4V6T5P2_DENBC|nr:hypothetical protein K435DRAFT_137091 [Dendrothele bispora CBS 962.96]